MDISDPHRLERRCATVVQYLRRSASLILFATALFGQDRPTLAVLDFEGVGISEFETTVLTNRLATYLVQAGQYKILERNEIAQILAEQDFQNTGCTTNECAVEIGQLLNAQFMLVGSYGKLGSTFTIDMRIIDVASGSIIKTASHDSKGEIDMVLSEGLPAAIRILFGDANNLLPVAPKIIEKPGGVSIRSIPPDATILVDEEEIGRTPLQGIDLDDGVHNVTVSKEDYWPLDTTIFVRSDVPSNLLIRLIPLKGSMSITTVPDSAGLLIRGIPAGLTPLDSLTMSTGSYAIQIQKDGYYQIDTTVTITRGKLADLRLIFRPLPSTISVYAKQTRASVMIDGISAGYSPIDNYLVAAGSHSISVAKSRFVPFDTTLTISLGEHLSLDVDLVPESGQVSISSVPNASVYIDTMRIGQTPLSGYKMPTGKHSLLLKQKEYAPFRAQFTIEHEALTELNYQLQKRSKISALAWSAVIPGGGQLYHGYVAEGLAFFALAAGLVYQTVDMHLQAEDEYALYKENQEIYTNATTSADIQESRAMAEENYNAMRDAIKKRNTALAVYGVIWSINLLNIYF